jgi:protein gp37
MLSLAPEHILTAPLRWKKPRTIFVNSMGDLFHCPHEWIDQVFAVMALAPQHTFQVLTKRAERMRGYMNHPRRRFIVEKTARILHNQGGTLPQHAIAYFTSCPAPLPHVWLGVSVEDQKRADERIPDLLHTPAAVRFISAEPLLGSIDLQGAVPALDWVIVGGESGPGARPMHPDWARSIRDQCGAAGVPFFFKQWGEHAPNGSGRYSMIKVGKRRAGRILDGREHNAMPEVRLLVPPRPALPR